MTISNFTQLTNAIASITAVVALGFTVWSIQQNTATVQAQAIYMIQKDAREIAKEFEVNPEVFRRLTAKNLDEEQLTNNTVGRLFNYYSSVYHQHRLGTLDDRLWSPFLREIGGFVTFGRARDFWMKKGKHYDSGFQTLINGLIAKENQ